MLERLTVFAINSGIWTAFFSLLAAILVRVSPALHEVIHLKGEMLTTGACILVKSDLCCILYPALFSLLQHAPRQSECQEVY